MFCEDAITDIKNGKIIVVVDDENRDFVTQECRNDQFYGATWTGFHILNSVENLSLYDPMRICGFKRKCIGISAADWFKHLIDENAKPEDFIR